MNFFFCNPPHLFFPLKSFAKVLPLLPPLPLKPPWTGRFIGWWQHIFLCTEKGYCHHFFLFFPEVRYFPTIFPELAEVPVDAYDLPRSSV